MKKHPRLNLNLPLEFSEKMSSNKQVVVRTQKEIDKHNKLIGYRKARMKRYGESATQRIKDKNI